MKSAKPKLQSRRARRPKILIAAGPTREFIDDVRYISNRSSGRMGIALVDAARAAGAEVIFVCGPIEQPPPKTPKAISITSANEMRRAVVRHAKQCDAVIMAAAVADFTPARHTKGKIKKTTCGLALRLVPTPDILVLLGRTKRRGQVLAGFALEAKSPRRNALKKLHAKNLDLIVLNSPAAMGADKARAEIIFADGTGAKLGLASKKKIAGAVVESIFSLLNEKKDPLRQHCRRG